MQVRKTITKLVFDILEEVERKDILENVDLKEEYMFDSLMIIELIANIEEEYGFEFDFDELDLSKIFNIEHLIETVEKIVK